jgi:8-oxo-dGTP pyrophosphatase MutT (NUDIX family)
VLGDVEHSVDRCVNWPAIAAARRRDAADPGRQRLPFRLRHDDGSNEIVGSVATQHLGLLKNLPTQFEVDDQAVTLLVAPAQRDAAMAEINAALRAAGAVRGWRNEAITLWSPDGRRPLAVIERASARFWGTLTLGAHCNGYCVDGSGRISDLWIARRSPTKTTDPGKLDNLIGGGVGLGQTPEQALLREAGEEAGLGAPDLGARERGRIIAIERDVVEGLQVERIHVFDLELPSGRCPVNRDGEVADFRCVPIDEALAIAAGGQMTVDASLVTLDFALRRDLFDVEIAARLSALASGLFVST